MLCVCVCVYAHVCAMCICIYRRPFLANDVWMCGQERFYPLFLYTCPCVGYASKLHFVQVNMGVHWITKQGGSLSLYIFTALWREHFKMMAGSYRGHFICSFGGDTLNSYSWESTPQESLQACLFSLLADEWFLVKSSLAVFCFLCIPVTFISGSRGPTYSASVFFRVLWLRQHDNIVGIEQPMTPKNRLASEKCWGVFPPRELKSLRHGRGVTSTRRLCGVESGE